MNQNEEQEKRKILRNSILLFSKKGYEKTRVNEISQSTHISVATFYELFSSKREVYENAKIYAINYVNKELWSYIKPKNLSDMYTQIQKRVKNMLEENDFNYAIFDLYMETLFGEITSDELAKSIENHERYKRGKYVDFYEAMNLKKSYELLLLDTFYLCNIFAEFNEFHAQKKKYYYSKEMSENSLLSQ